MIEKRERRRLNLFRDCWAPIYATFCTTYNTSLQFAFFFFSSYISGVVIILGEELHELALVALAGVFAVFDQLLI